MFKATKLKRLAFFLTFDIVIFVASFYLAYLLRFSGVLPDYFRGGLVGLRYDGGFKAIFHVAF